MILGFNPRFVYRLTYKSIIMHAQYQYSYLNNYFYRSQTVNVNNILSDFKATDTGIPQGSILEQFCQLLY